jgi:hypothetical protein
MGQQQLLLIVLGIIIVGIAIAVGVNMFQQSAVDTNRQAVVSDLTNLAAKAQRYYRTPQELGGGAQDFDGFKLGRLDTANANGSFRLYTNNPGLVACPAPAVANTEISGAAPDSIFIAGWGQEIGDDVNFKVQIVTQVTPTGVQTHINN